MLAAEFAAAAAKGGMAVAAVDAAGWRGNLHHRLDVKLSRDSFNLGDLLPVLGELDDGLLDRVLSEAPSGVMLLPRDPSPDGDVTSLPAVAAALRRVFDVLVVDGGGGPRTLELCLSGCFDLVALVVVPELSGVASARPVLERLRGAAGTRLALLVNRAGAGDSISTGDVRSYLGVRPSLVLAEATAACRRAGDEGSLLSEGKSALGEALRRMPRCLLALSPARPSGEVDPAGGSV